MLDLNVPQRLAKNMVVPHFGKIRSELSQPVDHGHLPPPWTAEAHRRYVRIIPVMDVEQISLTWCLPSLHHAWRSKPVQFLGELVGDEGEGSLLSALKREKLASGLCAGCSEDGFEFNSNFSLFDVSIELTDHGRLNLDRVVALCAAYMTMLRKVWWQRDERKSAGIL